MKSIIKDSLILCVITLVAGLLLGFVYDITKEPIAKEQARAKKEACKEVFANASDFVAPTTSIDTAKIIKDAGYTASVSEVLVAVDDNKNVLGYVMTAVSSGYGGDIEFTVGIQKDGTVNGISILTISETPGLGMKAKDSKFYGQYANKKVPAFTYVKGDATATHEISAISGATITTNAMKQGVNSALAVYAYLEANGGVSIE